MVRYPAPTSLMRQLAPVAGLRKDVGSESLPEWFQALPIGFGDTSLILVGGSCLAVQRSAIGSDREIGL
jgi:hypothetical protein